MFNSREECRDFMVGVLDRMNGLERNIFNIKDGGMLNMNIYGWIALADVHKSGIDTICDVLNYINSFENLKNSTNLTSIDLFQYEHIEGNKNVYDVDIVVDKLSHACEYAEIDYTKTSDESYLKPSHFRPSNIYVMPMEKWFKVDDIKDLFT